MNLILPVSLFAVVFLSACSAVLFWRLASRLDAQQITIDWLDEFSVETYLPMERLLKRSDVEFLSSQVGYRPEIAKRLMAERRKIFAWYLEHLVRDFNQLIGIGKLMVVYSQEDRHEFAKSLLRQQVRFYASICSVRLRLALYPLVTSADASQLVNALTAMRDRVQVLASPSFANFESA